MKKAIIFLLSVMMFTSMLIIPGNTGDVEAGVPEVTISALTPHAPIRIDSNADFPGIATAGDGGVGTPWIIENWDIDGTGFSYGIYVGNTTEHFVIKNCSLHDVGAPTSFPFFCNAGLTLYNVQNGTMDNNTASYQGYGMFMQSSFNNTVLNNNMSDNSEGIWVNSSYDNCFDNNTILNNNDGLVLDLSTTNTISNNTVLNNSIGIYLVHSNTNNVTNNTVSSINDGGIWQSESNSNVITSNTVTTSYYAILLMSSTNSTIYNNTMLNDGISILGDASEHWSTHNIDISNTANGKPVHYLKNQISGTIPAGAGQIILGNCTNVIIEGHNISIDVRTGIQLGFSDNNEIINNSISSFNWAGVWLQFSNNNTIVNNSVFDNQYCGIYLQSGNDNMIYHNNFSNNSLQASDASGNNSWDNDYPDGGNYWSDYTGIDNFTGPSQDIPGNDGIGDTNYPNIGGGTGTVDDYPLMTPFNGTTYLTNDDAPPNSIVYTITPYWLNSPIEITANASDNVTWVSNVTLFYIFSLDNGSFESWTEFGTDAEFPWNWTFGFPEGEGYYEFYSIAIDAFNNTELAPATADAFLAYDTTLPESEIFELDDFWLNNRTIYLDWNASDSLSGFGDLITGTFPSHENVDMWVRYSADNTTWTPWALAVENMWNGSVFNHTVLLDGYYQFYSIAQDLANNTELAPTEYDVFVGFDAVLPIAKAGDNQTISQYDQVIFDATNSTDSMGIVNYTWTFNYASQDLVVNMEKFNFTFNHYGHYEITLEVRDGAGNSATDTLWVTVLDTEDPIADAGEDQQSDPNIWVTFDGSGSTDNVAVLTYTWTFTYNETTTTLDGMYPKFKFAEHDTYFVTLTVTDEAGNSDTDTMQVYVAEDITQSGSSFAWIVVVFVLVLMVAALGIMMFYFKKGTQTQMDDRDRREARSHREEQYEDEYEDDDNRY